MLSSIKDFFSRFIEPGTHQSGPAGQHSLQVATAALLLEMVRMDNRIGEDERAAVADSLRRHFDLDAVEIDALVALAEQEARHATDYYQFTSLINKNCDAAQKIRIVEYLWQVALADGHLDAHELHLMRKINDLLHIPHAENIAAKQRARAAAKVPPAHPAPVPGSTR